VRLEVSDDLKLMICSRCGAPLIEIDDGLYECEYCQAKYRASKRNRDSENPELIDIPSPSKHSSSDLPETPAVSKDQPAHQAPPPEPIKKKKGCLVAYLIFIMLCFIGLAVYFLPNSSILKSPEERIEQEMSRYSNGYFAEWDLPSDFAHHEKYSVGAVMDKASVHRFNIGIPVYNRDMELITDESKYQNFDINSATVRDNKNHTYACEVYEYSYYRIEKGEDKLIGYIACDETIKPDVRSMLVEVVFENFGTETFELDLTIDEEDISISSHTHEGYGDNFSITLVADIESERNYIASIDSRSLSVVDNLGQFYQCEFDDSYVIDGVFVNTITGRNLGFASIDCTPLFPEEINRLVVTFTLQDKVYTTDILIETR